MASSFMKLVVCGDGHSFRQHNLVSLMCETIWAGGLEDPVLAQTEDESFLVYLGGISLEYSE